jgi:hypothetical protein
MNLYLETIQKDTEKEYLYCDQIYSLVGEYLSQRFNFVESGEEK